MPNQTTVRFGYPQTLIRDYEHWTVLLREQQVTLGSLVLCAKSDATAFSSLPPGAFAEMAALIADVERGLKAAVHYEKINYLMLMMVDPHVHFHVFPRYEGRRSACGVTLDDHGWPGTPDLQKSRQLTPEESAALRDYIAGFC